MTATDMTIQNQPPPTGGMIEVASSRVAQEVQAAVVLAKKFPRDEEASRQKILAACQRRKLAEDALYTYPRGGETISGPSIRLAEALARAYGNIDCGIVEVEQRDGESVMMSYAWDLESNLRETKVFTVPHRRYTRKGSYALSDPRDIYEMTANQGARRLRACILAVIPGDIQDEAVEACQKTLSAGDGQPIRERIAAMLKAFEGHGVTKEQVEARLGHRIEVTTEHELVQLGGIFKAIRDNFASAEDYFPSGTIGGGNGEKQGFGFGNKDHPADTAAAEAGRDEQGDETDW